MEWWTIAQLATPRIRQWVLPSAVYNYISVNHSFRHLFLENFSGYKVLYKTLRTLLSGITRK
jgi:hypothetical protein